MRDMDARDRLPAELKASNALIMTVGQSKGLEFDDCFLVGECCLELHSSITLRCACCVWQVACM